MKKDMVSDWPKKEGVTQGGKESMTIAPKRGKET